MQNTRLSTLFDAFSDRIVGLFINPWRRVALLAIALLTGFFLGGSAVTSTAGQLAYWDVPAAAAVTVSLELINIYVYRRPPRPVRGILTGGKLFVDTLNATKIGILYGLCLEGFKLNT
ncbi:DUF565 domain-containing protein [Oscillatoria sp. FACHB-1406]|uniref:DUF565 domain-containing protein n=1 Tax=Oscillatoria sp. FACHB-1406 TaxID=2692846 RepID=UPI001688DFBB|nr:DUF565 domain-containing protein [Oscillatoria sp. FACHB-1406]MBD2578328.1 DUF565 domain-containing protein [Oscillatoria sp. FACHB-1406]